ncbi:MAG TPA: hypothetical protein VLX64_06235 [Thermoplasmata archaeon]|nr:hypothetical protein [Thermoplasmata archaeon]
MVVASLTIGALVGIVLSGGFVYYEIGRFAEPQVPVTRFDERREIFAYTAGLFIGVPLAVVFVLYRLEITGAALIGAFALLAALVAGTEAAQIALLRSRFWSGPAGPFYALGFRAAVGGILALAIVASYAGGRVSLGVDLAATAITALAVVALEVAGGLLSLRPSPTARVAGGGPWSGAVFGAVGFFLLGLGPIAGPAGGAVAGGLVLVGSAVVYFRLRPLLARIAPPSAVPAEVVPSQPSAYGRTETGVPPAAGSAPSRAGGPRGPGRPPSAG